MSNIIKYKENCGVCTRPLDYATKSVTKTCTFCIFPIGWHRDWYPAPQRNIFFVISDEIAGQARDGEVRHFRAGSVLLAEDTTGKGHVSWIISRTDLLLPLFNYLTENRT